MTPMEEEVAEPVLSAPHSSCLEGSAPLIPSAYSFRKLRPKALGSPVRRKLFSSANPQLKTRSPQLRLLLPLSPKAHLLLEHEGEHSAEEEEAATETLLLPSWELGRCPLAASARLRDPAESIPEAA